MIFIFSVSMMKGKKKACLAGFFILILD